MLRTVIPQVLLPIGPPRLGIGRYLRALHLQFLIFTCRAAPNGAYWCRMKRPSRSRHPVPGESVARLSVSIPIEDKAALEKIADEKRVSLAWVMRDAVIKYLESADVRTLRKK